MRTVILSSSLTLSFGSNNLSVTGSTNEFSILGPGFQGWCSHEMQNSQCHYDMSVSIEQGVSDKHLNKDIS
jgi:hypothetical protein